MEQEKGRETVSKLQMDSQSDFKFYAAYMAYSETWDDNRSEEARVRLNELIASLRAGRASYEEFYSDLSQFRRQPSSLHRDRIQSRSKRDYRRSEKRSARDSRYRK